MKPNLLEAFEEMRKTAMSLKDVEFEAYINREMPRFGREYNASRILCPTDFNGKISLLNQG